MTRTTVEVLTLLLAAPAGDRLWAARIGELADLGRSTVSQIPVRLTALGWVTPRVEEGPHPGRPARAFCELTPRAAARPRWCWPHVRRTAGPPTATTTSRTPTRHRNGPRSGVKLPLEPGHLETGT